MSGQEAWTAVPSRCSFPRSTRSLPVFPSGADWFWVVPLALLAAAAVWYTRHPTARAVLRGRFGTPAGEIEALAALLDRARVHPRRVRVVQMRPGKPCWSHTYRHWIDHRLGVYRQFGRHGENAVGLERGRVVSLSLVRTDLDDMAPLAGLPALESLQLRQSRIERVAGLPEDCRWTHLVLQGNALADAEALAQAPALEEADLSFNRLEHLPPLQALSRLRRLDARLNRITDTGWMTGHPALERISLYGNPLSDLFGAAGLGRLEELEVGDAGLTSLAGLNNLPALRRLRASANHVRELGQDTLDACPSLEHLDLSANPLRRLPAGFAFAGRKWGGMQVRPAGGGWPEINVAGTPVAAQIAPPEPDGAATGPPGAGPG